MRNRARTSNETPSAVLGSVSLAGQKTYTVERNCCTSGNCHICHGRTSRKGSVRVEHTRTNDKAEADRIAKNFSEYDATVTVK